LSKPTARHDSSPAAVAAAGIDPAMVSPLATNKATRAFPGTVGRKLFNRPPQDL